MKILIDILLADIIRNSSSNSNSSIDSSYQLERYTAQQLILTLRDGTALSEPTARVGEYGLVAAGGVNIVLLAIRGDPPSSRPGRGEDLHQTKNHIDNFPAAVDEAEVKAVVKLISEYQSRPQRSVLSSSSSTAVPATSVTTKGAEEEQEEVRLGEVLLFTHIDAQFDKESDVGGSVPPIGVGLQRLLQRLSDLHRPDPLGAPAESRKRGRWTAGRRRCSREAASF